MRLDVNQHENTPPTHTLTRVTWYTNAPHPHTTSHLIDTHLLHPHNSQDNTPPPPSQLTRQHTSSTLTTHKTTHLLHPHNTQDNTPPPPSQHTRQHTSSTLTTHKTTHLLHPHNSQDNTPPPTQHQHLTCMHTFFPSIQQHTLHAFPPATHLKDGSI